MEVTKDETAQEAAPQMSDLDRKREQERLDIITRNRMAEEQSRANACIAELDILCKKYNCVLIADVRMIGAGRNVEQTLNVGLRALPAETISEADMKVEAPAEIQPTDGKEK